MNEENNIILPEPTLRRLPWYLAYVEILKANGVENVSSTQISRALSVDASQIAKDLSFLNIRGKTRIGYEVGALIEALSDFLGFTRSHKAYVIGTGSLGKALIRDSGLSNYGLEIVAGFDVNPDIIARTDLGVPIYHLDRIYEVMESNPASIGILTVPAQSAQECADTAIGAGIKAIWNFTPARIKVPAHIVVQNTTIYMNLAILFNKLYNQK